MSMGTVNFTTVTQATKPTAARFGVGFVSISDAGNQIQYSDGVNWSRVSSVIRPFKINGLGDSITSETTQYQPTGALNAPQWIPSRAYVVGNHVANNGLPYRCTVAGTSAGAGGPTGTGSSITDGGVTWAHATPAISLGNYSYLNWAEIFSNGQLNVNLEDGYAGFPNSCVKVFVIDGGRNYKANDRIIISGSGVEANLSIDNNGTITAVNLTNPGQVTVPFTGTILTSTGSGAILSGVHAPSGTFGITGSFTTDMVARLPDVLASATDIVVVHGGTNDIINAVSASTIIANLKRCYETLLAGGKSVIAMPIAPRTGLNGVQVAALHRVNNWIQSYCRLSLNLAPSNAAIDIADITGYWTDGASPTNAPVGGNTGTVAYAVTYDGLHPSPRGAQYIGHAIWTAAQRLIGGSTPLYPVRRYSQSDGYDPVRNPAGNMLEGCAWTASTAYAVGAIVSNDTAPIKIYTCTTAGTSAGAGGPTGTGTPTDGTVTWAYRRPAGLSVSNCGFAGTGTATGVIAYVGNIPTGTSFARSTGSAAGTITFTNETPWSNGQAGQRLGINFSLGSGAANELWVYTLINDNIVAYGLQNSDLLNSYIYAEIEVELSNVANLSWCGLRFVDTGGAFSLSSGLGITITNGRLMMASSGEMLPYPNGGKMLLRTRPILLPSTISSLALQLQFAFQASGGAASATTLAKVNYAAVRKVYVS